VFIQTDHIFNEAVHTPARLSTTSDHILMLVAKVPEGHFQVNT